MRVKMEQVVSCWLETIFVNVFLATLVHFVGIKVQFDHMKKFLGNYCSTFTLTVRMETENVSPILGGVLGALTLIILCAILSITLGVICVVKRKNSDLTHKQELELKAKYPVENNVYTNNCS